MNPTYTVNIDGDEYEETGLVFKESKTNRGFGLIEFDDRYGESCTLQESSLGTEAAIWFGTEGRVSRQQEAPGWKHYSPAEFEVAFGGGRDVLVHSRMHLTQRQVQVLLPFLSHFAEHGELPHEVPSGSETE